LKEEKVLVVGLGEVGRPMFELLKESGEFDIYGFDLDESRIKVPEQTSLPRKVDVIHICLPWAKQGEFAAIVTNYNERLEPKLTIINSTVPPGTTLVIYEHSSNRLVAHSHIRGVHRTTEYMKWEIKRWTKYVGGTTEQAAEAACEHSRNMGLRTKMMKGSTETEPAKLFETTYRVWMISCFQEMHRIANNFKTDFDDVIDFLEDTNRVRLDKPIMYPGETGGHCVIPNARLLLESYHSEFLRLILKSNRKRKQEMKNENLRKEAEKIKRRAEELQKDLIKKCAKNQ
jgi:UDP-N-acetyl-D-mannosaminuronate dehydrogenase